MYSCTRTRPRPCTLRTGAGHCSPGWRRADVPPPVPFPATLAGQEEAMWQVSPQVQQLLCWCAPGGHGPRERFLPRVAAAPAATRTSLRTARARTSTLSRSSASAREPARIVWRTESGSPATNAQASARSGNPPDRPSNPPSNSVINLASNGNCTADADAVVPRCLVGMLACQRFNVCYGRNSLC